MTSLILFYILRAACHNRT